MLRKCVIHISADTVSGFQFRCNIDMMSIFYQCVRYTSTQAVRQS